MAGTSANPFLQDLVHEHPEILPMADIEPAFMPFIPVCRELPTAAGYLDNLWLTPSGGIVLGECKLFRKPQARREVIAKRSIMRIPTKPPGCNGIMPPGIPG